MAGVLEVRERAGLECLGRHGAEIVAGMGREPGLGVRLRVGKVDEGGHSEVVMKQGDLAGARLVDNGEGERGGHRKHAIRLDDGHVGGAEVADMEGEGGGQGLLLRSLPHQAPRAVAGPPGGVLAAVALRRLRGTVGEADERAERAGVIELLRGKRRMGHGGSPWGATASEGASLLRLCRHRPLPHLSLSELHGEQASRRLATSGVRWLGFTAFAQARGLVAARKATDRLGDQMTQARRAREKARVLRGFPDGRPDDDAASREAPDKEPRSLTPRRTMIVQGWAEPRGAMSWMLEHRER